MRGCGVLPCWGTPGSGVAWPGLATTEREPGKELRVTTELRRVLTDSLIRRSGGSDIDTPFRGSGDRPSAKPLVG